MSDPLLRFENVSRRILTAEFQHESNTFKRGATTLEDFAAETLLEDDAAVSARGAANTELAGFLDAARREGWTVRHAISALASPGAPVARAAFDHVAGRICGAAASLMPRLDGVLLALHGAMVTDFCDDGEGELLARLRAVIGTDVPVAVTLDMHAVVSDPMLSLAPIVLSYKTYPHIDMRDIGQRAAALLARTMTGEIRPATRGLRLPMLEEANGGRHRRALDGGALCGGARARGRHTRRLDQRGLPRGGCSLHRRLGPRLSRHRTPRR